MFETMHILANLLASSYSLNKYKHGGCIDCDWSNVTYLLNFYWLDSMLLLILSHDNVVRVLSLFFKLEMVPKFSQCAKIWLYALCIREFELQLCLVFMSDWRHQWYEGRERLFFCNHTIFWLIAGISAGLIANIGSIN